MKGLVFTGPNEVSFTDLQDPWLETPTDAVIKIGIATICGSDLHVYHGRETGIDAGTVMGHEITGEIVELGKAVKNFQIGDRVVSPFSSNCGICFYCQQGLPSRCEQGQLFGWRSGGVGLHGGQAQYVRVPFADATLYNIGELSYEKAVLTACNLGTGWFAAEQAQVKPGKSVGVVGCGTVGLMAIKAAKAMGAEQIFAFDIVADRLAKAALNGAIPVESREQVLDLTGGRGLDCAIEAVGSGAALRTAFDFLRPGGIISAVGVDNDPSFSISPTEAYDKNITYLSGRCPARNYIPELVAALQQDKIEVEDVLTHRCDLSEGSDCYRNFSQRKPGYLKVLMRP